MKFSLFRWALGGDVFPPSVFWLVLLSLPSFSASRYGLLPPPFQWYYFPPTLLGLGCFPPSFLWWVLPSPFFPLRWCFLPPSVWWCLPPNVLLSGTADPTLTFGWSCLLPHPPPSGGADISSPVCALLSTPLPSVGGDIFPPSFRWCLCNLE